MGTCYLCPESAALPDVKMAACHLDALGGSPLFAEGTSVAAAVSGRWGRDSVRLTPRASHYEPLFGLAWCRLLGLRLDNQRAVCCGPAYGSGR